MEAAEIFVQLSIAPIPAWTSLQSLILRNFGLVQVPSTPRWSSRISMCIRSRDGFIKIINNWAKKQTHFALRQKSIFNLASKLCSPEEGVTKNITVVGHWFWGGRRHFQYFDLCMYCAWSCDILWAAHMGRASANMCDSRHSPRQEVKRANLKSKLTSHCSFQFLTTCCEPSTPTERERERVSSLKHIPICMCICMYVCLYVCLSVCMYACMYVSWLAGMYGMCGMCGMYGMYGNVCM